MMDIFIQGLKFTKFKGGEGSGWFSPPKGTHHGTGLEGRLIAFAEANGFPADSIVALNSNRSIDGMPVMAELERRTGRIVVYEAAPKSSKKLEPMLVHELMHAKTEKIPNHEMAGHIREVVGVERWKESAWKSMEKTGGVSDYAKWSWKNESGNKAVKETLSEIARLDFQGQIGSVSADWQKLYNKVMGGGK